MADTFRCDGCEQSFPKAWSDADAVAELESKYPGVDVEDCAVVCDDCQNRLTQMPGIRLQTVSTHRADVTVNGQPIGYIVRMLEGMGIALNPAQGHEPVGYMVSPARGGIARARAESMATAPTLIEAVSRLWEMR